MQKQFNWSHRIESDMQSIDWIMRRDMDVRLPNRSYADIYKMLTQLISDVQEQTREDDRRERR
jgi:hypothetical protein